MTDFLNNTLGALTWPISWKHPWGFLSKWQIHLLHTYYMITLTTISWFSPYLGGGSVGNLTLALLPIQLTRGLGWGRGWPGPPLVSVFANARAGSGSRGQPLHVANTYTSYAQCPGNFVPKSSLNLRQIVDFSLDNPSSSLPSLFSVSIFHCPLHTFLRY